jgi:hypothetical protein
MYNSFNQIHHLIQIDNTSDPSVEAVHIVVKLKLVAGTLQMRAAKFRSANTRICEICNEEDEDIEHFLLGCKILQCVGAPFLNEQLSSLYFFIHFSLRENLVVKVGLVSHIYIIFS